MLCVEPLSCSIDVAAGTMVGATGRYEKRLSDLDGLYENAAAFSALVAERGNPVVYEVGDVKPAGTMGDMIFGVTRMSPGRIGREFFFTRGHIHALANRPEVYVGQKGRGLMQLEAPDGDTRIVEIGPQTICYVPPYWIHRSINVGADDLVMSFSYPADAGQDYGIIERSGGMRHRVVASDEGGWMLVDNAAYRPRSKNSVDALFQNGV